jgi:hypothetical protein
MAVNSTKTKEFMRLEILRNLNAPFTIDQYSTLNENITVPNPAATLVAPPATGYPTIKCIGIGRGGLSSVIGSGNNTLVDIPMHGVTDAALFGMIPIVMVPTTADLSTTQRANYRLRTLETFGGIDYFCYYLKVFDTSTIQLTEHVLQLTNGTITSDTAFTPSSSSLTPTPVDLSNTIVNTSTGRHLFVQAVIPIVLNQADIDGIINVCATRFGDIRTAFITEIAAVAGFDTTVNTTIGGVTANYTELQCAQVMGFIAAGEMLQTRPSGITFQFGLSSTAPYPPTS